ncbi:MAG: hypothetical protein HY928_11455 [Elusimicrobia bacterium]|nr:hypothetical protein [Elusimicrobiota bacterium]
MRNILKKGLVLGFAFAALGALAISPGFTQTNDRGTSGAPNGTGMTGEEAQAYRDGYNASFQKAKEDQQAALDKEQESSGGCCG